MPAETEAYVPVDPADLHPNLFRALRGAGWIDKAEIWECRVCAHTTRWVLVVPYDGAWGHAVEPRCEAHYPEGAQRLCTVGWAGPSTPTLGARRRRAEETLTKALAHVEAAARELDALFDQNDDGPHAKAGGFDEWKLDGRRQTADVSLALLSLHDYLNDVTQARAALEVFGA